MQAGGRLAMNRSLPYDSPHLLMSNLEPRHTYYIQVAAFNSRGTGPFSETLEVRPEPSLAHLGSPAGISGTYMRLYLVQSQYSNEHILYTLLTIFCYVYF